MSIRTMSITIILLLFSNITHADEITFASFNTFWLYDDQAPHKKWWDSQGGATGQTYQQAIAKVAEAIKKTEADVVALQEIENKSVLEDLQTRLQTIGVSYSHAWIGKGTDTATGQDVALLSKFPKDGGLIQKYPNERETYKTENDPGNENDTGLSKVLRVNLNVDSKKVSVFVFHLKSQRGGGVSDSQRLSQASIVRRITLPFINKKEMFVVMGDMNADRGSPSLLRMRGFDDVYADLVQPVHDDDFSGDKWTYKFNGRTQQIDHILLSPSLRKSFKNGKINYTHGKETSDHFPIVVTVDI